MSTANAALQVADLDFDDIRSSLKTYLESQTRFTDYNFDGSSLSILLDILAYNTHYNSFYMNMIANEMFLDSALIRNSVVSRAKELDYTPISALGAVAETTIQIVPSSSPTTISVPKFSQFTTTVDDDTLTFVTEAAFSIKPDASSDYIQTGVSLVEGFPLTHTYTVSSANPVEYLLPNENSDTSRLTVQVQESASDTTINSYTLANDINELTGTSKVFFLHENKDGEYEVTFGDSILGKSLSDGNLVKLTYLVNNTTKGNGANTFTVVGSIDGHSSVTVTTTTVGAGGVAKESIESVKFNAPKHFERQNRAVTNTDYERIILAENSDFSAVSVWGGEDNAPAVYGRVYMAVKPSVGTVISTTRKAELVTSLKKRNVLSIDPVVVDAEYLYVVPTVEVVFNPDKTTKAAGTIESEVTSAITTFQNTNLNNFGKKLRYSVFTTAMDTIDLSILGNQTTFKLQKRITPTTGTATKYTLEYANSLLNTGSVGDIVSSTFTFGGFTAFLQDNTDGSLDIVRTSAGVTTILSQNIGTVDYDAGTITLTSFNPSAVDNSGVLKIDATPVNKDVTPVRDQIILFADSSVSSTEDRELT
jgi:hypothetical protein